MRFVLRQGTRDRVAEVAEEGGRLTVTLDGEARPVDFIEGDQGFLSLLIDGKAHACDFEARKGNQVRVYLGQSVFELEVLDERKARRQLAAGGVGASGPQEIVAPMPGKIVRVLVKVGQAVKAGEGLIVIEAMKMENELRAARAGTVKEIAVQEGVAVEGGAKLCVVE
jgi:biotin carboxyl carrier protein